MRVLHTQISKRFHGALTSRLARFEDPVELAPLGAGPGEALLIGNTLTEDEFREAVGAGVRWVQSLMAGVEDLLIPPLVESDVVFTSGGGTSAAPMAEFVFARILERAKRLRTLAELQAAREWKPTWLGELAGRTLTVVGLGPIGRRVAELGRAFGMHVIGVRRRPEAGPGPCHEVVGTKALPSVLGRTDYLVLAPALTPETRGMIGAVELAAMKPGSLLVNVGRGELVDERSLLAALGTGSIEAALDVFAEEPLPAGSPLWEAPGLAVSPHSSALGDTLLEGLADLVADNIDRFRRGAPLRNVVDKASGYPLPEAEESVVSGRPQESTPGRRTR